VVPGGALPEAQIHLPRRSHQQRKDLHRSAGMICERWLSGAPPFSFLGIIKKLPLPLPPFHWHHTGIRESSKSGVFQLKILHEGQVPCDNATDGTPNFKKKESGLHTMQIQRLTSFRRSVRIDCSMQGGEEGLKGPPLQSTLRIKPINLPNKAAKGTCVVSGIDVRFVWGLGDDEGPQRDVLRPPQAAGHGGVRHLQRRGHLLQPHHRCVLIFAMHAQC